MDPSDRLFLTAKSAASALKKLGHGTAGPSRPLPDPIEVEAIGEDLRRLLFPELTRSGGEPPDEPTLARHLFDWATRLRSLLTTELHLSCADPSPRGSDCAGCQSRGEAITAELIVALPQLRALLAVDLGAFLDCDPAAQSAVEVALCYPGFYAIASHRLASLLWTRGARLVARILCEKAHARTGIDIHPGAQIGPGFFIDHGTGVVVGETAVIGERVRLYQGVTIGAKSVHDAQKLHGVKRHPTLEDDVIVYANATILGGDTVIGRGAIVGGNCWVVSSVAPGGRILQHGSAVA